MNYFKAKCLIAYLPYMLDNQPRSSEILVVDITWR